MNASEKFRKISGSVKGTFLLTLSVFTYSNCAPQAVGPHRANPILGGPEVTEGGLAEQSEERTQTARVPL